MSAMEYKQRHPLAWALIAGVALFSVAGVGAIRGWLPGSGSGDAVVTCANCAVVESVRAVDAPPTAIDGAPADEAGTAAAASGNTGEAPADETVARVSHGYEVTVRYKDGSTGVVSQIDPPVWQAGDRVRVINGATLVAG